MDEMLDIIKNLVEPEGRGRSRYAGAEMKQLDAVFQAAALRNGNSRGVCTRIEV